MATTLYSAQAGETFSFLTFLSETGFLLSTATVEEEVIETPGVDGHRWRTIFKQFTPTTVETLVACASFGDAVITANNYRKAKGGLCTITLTGGGRTEIFRDVHISDVRPVPRAGQVTATEASANNQAHVYCQWTFELSEFAPSASA